MEAVTVRLLLILSLCGLATRGEEMVSVKAIRTLFLETFQLKVPKAEIRENFTVPEFIMEEYKMVTGINPNMSNFIKRGLLQEDANNIPHSMSFERGTVISRAKGLLPTQTIIDVPKFKAFPADGKFHAFLQVYWKPQQNIKRKKGAFKVRAYDLVKFSKKSPEMQITLLHDIKKIHCKDPELDEGWYQFDVTLAVARYVD